MVCQFDNLHWNILCNILIFVVGTAVLLKGSDLFVDAAAALARIWKVPELVIGLTLVSIGTSLPELASSVYASAEGQAEFTIGNIVGSNVANIALILGAGICGAGVLPFKKKMLKRDGCVMMAVYLLLGLLLYFSAKPSGETTVYTIGITGGILFLTGCILYMLVLFKSDSGESAASEVLPGNRSVLFHLGVLILGIAMITAGSKAMVDPTVWAAKELKIPMLVISSTIVAVGTSIPELAVTITGIVKKQHDIALGNIIGSNIFNILLIFGITALISPLKFTANGVGIYNVISMFVTGAGLLLLMVLGGDKVRRRDGVLLLVLYSAYLIYNVAAAFESSMY